MHSTLKETSSAVIAVCCLWKSEQAKFSKSLSQSFIFLSKYYETDKGSFHKLSFRMFYSA